MWVMAPHRISVGKWEYAITGLHTSRSGITIGVPFVLNQFDPADLACIKQGAPLDGRTISGAPEAPYFVDRYPEGAGNTIAANKILGLNPHYFNEFDVPIQVKGYINLHPVEGSFTREVETLFSGAAPFEGQSAYTILVPPFATASLRLACEDSRRPMRFCT